MLWPTVCCSLVTAGLWIARQELPDSLSPYTDIIALVLIVTMFVWLVRRALRRPDITADEALSVVESHLSRRRR